MSAGDFLWDPQDHAWTGDSQVARFMASLGIPSLEILRRQAAADGPWFWDAAVRDLGLEWRAPYQQVRDDRGGLPWTRWFVGGRLNVAENCVERPVRQGRGDTVALYWEGGDGRARGRLTYAELARDVRRCAGALRAGGVKPGDAVAAYLPLGLPAAVAMLAAFRLGAVFVPIFCGYGEEALRERVDACGARVLLACRTLERRGKRVDAGGVAQAAAAGCAAKPQIVWTDEGAWAEWLAGAAADREPAAATQAEDPCLILYTSGTTGRPKGTVHTHAGCLAQIAKELKYAFDLRPGEPLLWVTDIGWMMGPWALIGGLFHGAGVVLLDGPPNFPAADRLWEVCARLGVVTLGCSPTVIRQLRRDDPEGPGRHDLSRLRVLGSTGEVWDEPHYRWYFSAVGGERCPVINISGGTEIIGCFLQPYPVEPLKACSLGGPALGMDVAIVDDAGREVGAGVTGHLVCRQPAPSMTKGFLHDPERYLETYFQRFPGVWCHGDWARRDEDGQWFLQGRTDDTFKVAGKRVSAAEIEETLARHPAVAESAAIGVPDPIKGTALIALAVLRAEATEEELRQWVGRQMGKPLMPDAVHRVNALPKTRSGKIVRGAIGRAFASGRVSAADAGSVENPEALAAVAALRPEVPA